MSEIGALREAKWCEAHDTLGSVIDAIEAEQTRLSAAALGVCKECDNGWIEQDEPHGVAPCPYCQPEKYDKTPWDRFVPAAVPADTEETDG